LPKESTTFDALLACRLRLLDGPLLGGEPNGLNTILLPLQGVGDDGQEDGDDAIGEDSFAEVDPIPAVTPPLRDCLLPEAETTAATTVAAYRRAGWASTDRPTDIHPPA
jgi:hypothetical protein